MIAALLAVSAQLLWAQAELSSIPETEPGTALRGLFHDVEKVMPIWVADVLAQQRAGHDDWREGVVEVVRDAGRQHPDILEPLRTDHLLLRLLALGNVFINAEHAHGLPCIVEQRELAGPEPKGASIRPFLRFFVV